MKELLVEIFLFLSPDTIINKGSLVCKEWYETLKNEYLWENWYLRLFNRPTFFTYSFKRQYIKKIKRFYNCQICHKGSKSDRRNLDIIVPCECNLFFHNSCVIKHNLKNCKICNQNYEFKVHFNFKTAYYIINYIIVLGSSQLMLLSLPLFFKDGLKKLGNISLVFLICYSLYTNRGIKSICSSLLFSYYLYLSNSKNGSVGVLVMYTIQNVLFLKLKKYLDYFWLDNIFKTVNKTEKDLYLL